jgi:short-subunit dehydrogenase
MLKKILRRFTRAVTFGLISSATLAGSAYWLNRYLRPRHSPLELDGAVAVIADADTPLGQSFARALAQRGLRLALAGRNADSLIGLRLAVDPYAADVLTIIADSRTEAGQATIIDATVAHYKQIGLLIIDTGRVGDALQGGLPDAVALTHRALPVMRRHDSGVVVYVMSIAGRLAMPGLGEYTAAAQGLTGFAEALRHEMAGTRVTVTNVIAGWQQDETTPDTVQRWLARMNWPTVTPDDIALATIHGLLNRQDEIFVSSTFNRLLAWTARHVPPITALYWRTANSPEWLAAAHDLTGK